ncbi:MAG: class I SAM-dependent methyltransferase [Acidimicrobiia bacterium]
MNPTKPPDREVALRQVRRVIDRLVRDGTAVSRLDGSVHSLFPVAVSAAEGEALREWVTREAATHTIEIGLGYAIAALFVCEGLLANGDATARHVVVDPFQAGRFANCGLQFLDEAGLADLVEYYPEESQIALPRFHGEGRSFDLAFVDGNHRFDGVFLDLVYLGRLVRGGGIVFLDDYQLPAVARAASFFLTNLGWRSKKCQLPTISTSGPCSGPRTYRTRDRSTTTSTSNTFPRPRATFLTLGCNHGFVTSRVLKWRRRKERDMRSTR